MDLLVRMRIKRAVFGLERFFDTSNYDEHRSRHARRTLCAIYNAVGLGIMTDGMSVVVFEGPCRSESLLIAIKPKTSFRIARHMPRGL